MKIVLFHPVPLPPKDYGGVERVVLWLAKGLIERGHEVWIAALEGSQLPDGARLISVSKSACSAADLVSLLPSGVDLVHFMAPPLEHEWGMFPCAGVLTVHGNGKSGERFHRNSIFLSQNHASRHHANVFVYNGIDPVEYRFDPQSKTDAYLFLSKTSWKVKNLEFAMQVCELASKKLQIAGGNRPLIPRIRALLNPLQEWVGPVAGTKKADLLAQAKALVFPVKWQEPFGLVAIEALMSGTPVIGSNLGSLPELITPEVGALLSLDQKDSWVEVLGCNELPWSPETCRARAMEFFHYAKMAQNYELIYRRVIQGNMVQDQEPYCD